MNETCGWQDKRGNDCARPAVWEILGDPDNLTDRYVYCCNVHLGDIVKERAVEWVGCWVDKA
jgi:hypothetical protein